MGNLVYLYEKKTTVLTVNNEMFFQGGDPSIYLSDKNWVYAKKSSMLILSVNLYVSFL